MTPETLALVAGIILSLIFSYVPGLNTKFAGLSSEIKRVIILGLCILVGAGAFGLTCAGFGSVVGAQLACTKEGLVTLFQSIVLVAIANQSAYGLSPQTAGVTRAKEERVEG
jgi:hypothetical protein